MKEHRITVVVDLDKTLLMEEIEKAAEECRQAFERRLSDLEIERNSQQVVERQPWAEQVVERCLQSWNERYAILVPDSMKAAWDLVTEGILESQALNRVDPLRQFCDFSHGNYRIELLGNSVYVFSSWFRDRIRGQRVDKAWYLQCEDKALEYLGAAVFPHGDAGVVVV